MNTVRTKTILLSVILVTLSACVPMRGDYSEFANRPNQETQDATHTESKNYAQGSYRGELRNGFPHGKGIFSFWNGTVYQGQFQDGRFHGTGRMTYNDSSVIEGTFLNDREHQVTLTKPDGSVFSGQVVGGKPAGEGILRLSDNSRIVGNFEGDRVKGTGLVIDGKGVPRYAGPIEENRPHGQGICSDGFCEMAKGQNITASSQERAAQEIAVRQVADELNSELSDETERHKNATGQIESQRDAAEARFESHAGPKYGETCYCRLRGCMHLVVEESVSAPAGLSDEERIAWWERHRAREEQSKKIAELRQAKERLECKQRYAGWLGISQDPDYLQKLTRLEADMKSTVDRLESERRAEEQRHADHRRKLEAQHQKRLADEAELRRLAAEARAKLVKEQQDRMDRLKANCSEPSYRRSNPCKCSVLSPVESPSNSDAPGACEA